MLYLREGKTIWGSLRQVEDSSYSERKRLCNAVFNGESISGIYMGNQYVRKLPRGGRAMRWLATSDIPDVYESLWSDGKKKRADSIAMSHFVAGIESIVLGTLSGRCKALRTGGDYVRPTTS